VPEVLGCHQIRSRGSADHVFVDLHVWMDPNMRLEDAHHVSHIVKDRIMARYPQVKDAIIHIEPPPRGYVERPLFQKDGHEGTKVTKEKHEGRDQKSRT
jgi:divalent metal cation (Fe/Co/Zn/Cd) transporter